MRKVIGGLAFLAACDGGMVADRASLVGDYPMVAFNGRAMPALYDSSDVATVRMTYGMVRLNADGTYREEFVWVQERANDGATATTTHARWGEWAWVRGRVYFRSGDARLVADVRDGQMRYAYDGKAFVFAR